MVGTYFNKQRKLGVLDNGLGSSDVFSVFTTEHVTHFTVQHFSSSRRLFRLNMAESD